MTNVARSPETVFNEALEIESPAERRSYLDRACEGDIGLRQAVEKLITLHSQAGNFLESPAVNLDVTALAPALDERPGTVIGPYKLLQQIGEGGMGVVFMAEQTEPIHRSVALKIIKPGMDTRQVIARFEAERQALAMMDHPNIARVIDAGTTDTRRPYFVMDLVKGVPITDYCDQQHLSVRQRLELIGTVCQAVQHAHQKGIIHRDIKPSNVLVAEYDGKPVPKIIDFGVAKATAQKLTERTMFTEFGQVIGTVEYMSPEQARFNQLDVDTRSDIYSLGVLLYELLTGSTPFERKRLREAAFDEVLRIICEEEPPKPSTRLSTSDTLPSIAANRHTEPARLNKDISGELDWIVMRCLEKDRNRRYETANGLGRDIERYLQDEPVQACPPSRAYRLRKFARRNKAAFAGISIVAMSLIVGTAVSVWQATVARRAERLAQSRLEQANTETAKANRIASFLEEMLASANPEEGKGLKYTVRQMLDDFSNELGSQLADQPEVEAAVRSIIGKAYWRLGENKIARGHIKAALDLRRRLLAPDDTRIADNLVDYASLESAGENRAGAERLAREALAIYQKQNAGPRPVLAAMWNVHRFTWLQYKRPNRFADADVVAKEALAVAGDLDTTPYPEAANIVRSISQAKLEEKNSARRKTGHARPWPFTAVSTATVIRRRAWVTSA